ncbi:hypothetical protein [Rahnella bonaserana]
MANLFASGDEIGVINVLEAGVVYLPDMKTNTTLKVNDELTKINFRLT